MSVKNLGQIPGLRKLKYGGQRVTIDSLNGKDIIIRDYIEVRDTKFGSGNNTYLRVAADMLQTGSNIPVIFNTSSKVVRQQLTLAQSYLPVQARVCKVQSKNGFAYWTLQG